MPIHKRIISGFKKLAPFVTPFITGGPVAGVLGVAGALVGGRREEQVQVQQATARVAGPILSPSRFAPQPQLAVDPAVSAADTQRDIDRIVSEIRKGSRSRSNVPPRLKRAVDAALGSFVFGQVPGAPMAAPGRPGETAITRWQAEVLAGTRSFDNFPPGVTSAMKRQLAARVLKKLGPGFLPPSFRPGAAVAAPEQVAARRPFQPISVQPISFQFGGLMPVRQFGQPSIEPTFAQFGAVGIPAAGPAIAGVPAISTASVVELFAAVMRKSGISAGVRAIATWIRGNPATAGALALSAGLTADQLLDDISEKAMIKSITGGVVLSRNDLKGFNRTVRVAKKLKVFARRAPRRARSVPGHRHTVRSHR